MGALFFTLIQIAYLIAPLFFFLTIFSAYKAYEKASNERKTIRETEYVAKKLLDYLPKRIEKALNENPKNCKQHTIHFMKVYRNCFSKLIIYFFLWGMYICIIFIRICHLASGLYTKYNLEVPWLIGFYIGASILETYWFFLMPIFEIFHQDKLVQIGHWLYQMLGRLVVIGQRLMISVGGALTSFILLIVGVNWFQECFTNVINEYGSFAYLIFLATYQYGALKIVSLFINWIITKCKKNDNKPIKVTKDTIYKCIKNCSYLSMIFISSFTPISESDVGIAIGILFLVDDYLIKEKDLFQNNKDTLTTDATEIPK